MAKTRILIIAMLSLLFLTACTSEATKQGFECLKGKAIGFCIKNNAEFLGIKGAPYASPQQLIGSYYYDDFKSFVCMDKEKRQKEEYFFLDSELEECRPK